MKMDWKIICLWIMTLGITAMFFAGVNNPLSFLPTIVAVPISLITYLSSMGVLGLGFILAYWRN